MISSTFAAVFHFFAAAPTDPQGLLNEAGLDLQVAAGHDVVEHRHAGEQRDVLEGAGDTVLGCLVGVHVAARCWPWKVMVPSCGV